MISRSLFFVSLAVALQCSHCEDYEYDYQTNQEATTSPTTPNTADFDSSIGPPTLGDLLAMQDTLSTLRHKPVSFSTVGQLMPIYIHLQKLSSQFVEENQATITKLRETLAAILNDIAKASPKGGSKIARDLSIVMQDSSKVPTVPHPAMPGVSVFKNSNLQIEQIGLATAERRSVFVVYKRNVSPFKTLPSVPFLLDYQVVDLVIANVPAEGKKLPAKPGQSPFQKVTFRVTTKEVRHNTKYACAFWHDTHNAWTSQGCFVFSDTPDQATCMCDTQHASNTTHFVVYSYHDFNDDILNFMTSNIELEVSRTADFNPFLRKVTDRGGNVEERPSALDDLVTGLSAVFLFDPTQYASTSGAAISHAIGATLSKVIPFEETGILGRGNSKMTAVVVRLDLFKGDPPIGFAFYSDRSLWMEYQRSEDLNANRLFANQFAFAFYFSASVIGQNTRYAFLVYPEDVSLQAPPSLKRRHSVVASRVVDFVLSSKPGDKKEDELVTLHFLPDAKRTGTEFGCASWSDLTGTWDTAVCVTAVQLFRRSECTCNMSAVTKDRKQFMMFEFSPSQYYQVSDIQKQYEVDDWLFRESTMFSISTLAPLPDNADSVEVILQLLNKAVILEPNIPILYEPKTVRALSRNLHTALKSITQYVLKNYKPDGCNYLLMASKSNPTTSLGDGFVLIDGSINFYENSGAYVDLLVGVDFAVKISSEVELMFDYRGFLLYPPNIFPCQLPRLGPNLKIVSYRVIDVVLATNKPTSTLDNNYVEMYLKGDEGKLGCAFWSPSADDWTREGCGTVTDLGAKVCRCNLGGSKTGGQLLVFSYESVGDEENILETLAALKNETQVLSQATLYLENTLPIAPSVEMLMTHLEVVDRVLSLNDELLSKNKDCFKLINKTTWSILDEYYSNSNLPVMHSFAVPANGTLKNSNLFTDLYSSTFSQDDKSNMGRVVQSNFTMVALGFYQTAKDVAIGFYFKPDMNETVQLMHDEDMIRYLPSKTFAVSLLDTFVLRKLRFVFLVYPLNKASFPPENLSRKVVFNIRAVDIHIKEGNRVVPEQSQYDDGYSYDDSNTDGSARVFQASVDIYSQVTLNPKRYSRIGCSVWQEKSSKSPTSSWSSDIFWPKTDSICSVNQADRNALCRCTLDNRVTTKVLIFEYADLPNFSSKTDFDAKGSMFIVSSFFSILGIAFIALTALFYPEWRRSFGNKIFINLSAATFFYLVATMYRETNVIYFDPDQLDKLAAMSVLVHYTRLVHYDWMAVVSIQQWQGAAWSGLEQSEAKFLLRKIMLIAWGLPILPLIVALTWNVKEHLVTPDKTMHYLLFIGPGLLTTVINILLLFAITVRMARFWYLWKKEFGKIGMSDRTMMLMQLKSLIQMFFLFGIPTSFEIFNSFGAKNAVLDFLFKVTDPLQGFMLFVFFICLDKGTRKLWMSCDSGSLIRLDLEFPEEEVNHFDRGSQRTTMSSTWGMV